MFDFIFVKIEKRENKIHMFKIYIYGSTYKKSELKKKFD